MPTASPDAENYIIVNDNKRNKIFQQVRFDLIKLIFICILMRLCKSLSNAHGFVKAALCKNKILNRIHSKCNTCRSE